jgi:lysophospholipase L1-like esterase
MRRHGLLALACCAIGCGGSPAGPGPGPGPTAEPGFDVAVLVYYDENGDGQAGATEGARVPGVTVDVAGRTGRTESGTGRVVVRGVPAGAHAVTIRPGALPPFYAAGAAASVTVPQPAGQEVRLAATLPIGSNRPNTYMAFGDSLTLGLGSTDGAGYRMLLQDSLRGHFARGEVLNRGDDGTQADEGASRIGRGLRTFRPAYTLTMYGTNDWNNLECRTDFPCDVIESLATIVALCQDADSLPVLATIPPANPAQEPPERNEWVARLNDEIRVLARSDGALLADVHAAFLRESDLPSLFSDHIHPNDRGYAVLAQAFFEAIRGPTTAGASGAWPGLLFAVPAGLPGGPPHPRPGRPRSRR